MTPTTRRSTRARSKKASRRRPLAFWEQFNRRALVEAAAASQLFDQWLSDLTNRAARARITWRIDPLSRGNAGDVKAVGEGVSEMRIDTGPGYRVYYKQTGMTIIVILCGGDKSSQDKDIKKAKQMAAGH